MSEPFVRMIADDLTGALDSAAPFASPERPMRLLVPGAPAPDAASLAGVTTSSESRDLDESLAREAVGEAAKRIAGIAPPRERPPLDFGKLDSVLRGHPIVETLAKMAAWASSACLFAPAFPEMGRRTVGGRQEQLRDGAWHPCATHDIVAAFADRGTVAPVCAPGERISETSMVIGDADAPGDLERHVATFRDRPDILWAGSRGLAQALAGRPRTLPVPAITTVVVGTTHEATRAQVARLRAAGLGVGLIDPAPDSETPATTRDRVARAVADLRPDEEAGLLVVGGDTLSETLAALGEGCALDCIGEVAPGVPLSRVVGGRFAGLPLVTKSGGFGGEGLLVDLLKSVGPPAT